MPSDLVALKRVFDRIESADIAVVVVSYAETACKLMPPSGRRETLKRAEARPGVIVEPRHCYVVRSERPVVLRNGHFEAVTQGRANRPTSDLLVSLSEELGSKSVAVLLSGTSAEAIDGLRAIRAKGGTVIVQDPTSAVFDDAPRAAIAAGVADSVMLPAQIGDALA